MSAINKRWMTVVILLLSLLVKEVYAAEKLDLRTLCEISGSKRQTILLVDTSDPLTPVAQARLKELLKGFIDAGNEHYLHPADELIVYRLSPQIADMRKPLLRVCNPGNPRDRTVVDGLISSLVEAKKRWRAFEGRMVRVLHKLNEETLNTKSPLLENMAVVTARHIPSLGIEQRKPMSLFLFSDMLQNSNLLSHYKSLPSMKKFKSLVGYSEMDSDLTDVKVWLFYVRRTGSENVQTAKHYYWWTQAIELFGGRLMEQVPL